MEYGSGGAQRLRFISPQRQTRAVGIVHSSQRTENQPSAHRKEIVRGKVQHTSNHSRSKKYAHDHQTFRESYCCCQQDVQSKLNPRLNVFTDKGQGNGECDRRMTRKVQCVWTAPDSNCIGGPNEDEDEEEVILGSHGVVEGC